MICFMYLKSRRKLIILTCLCVIIFFAVMWLGSELTSTVIYAVLLCAAALLVAAAFDFYGFFLKHRLLTEIKAAVTVSADMLPEAANALENDYQLLIKELFNAVRAAESASTIAQKEMNDYYTLWAHQIKTPIAAMRLLMQSGECDGAELENQLFKIEQYVEMVLQYIRTESVSTDYVIKKYPLDSIIKQAVRKYARLFINKKITLEYTDIVKTVVTDEKWLLFVLEQLLSNALKYTPVGGTVRIYAANAPYTIVIEDNGIGISCEDLPRVCDKGYTGYNGRADKKSTGIGLYLCVQVLNKLSHLFKIESDGESGTRVLLGLE